VSEEVHVVLKEHPPQHLTQKEKDESTLATRRTHIFERGIANLRTPNKVSMNESENESE